MTGEADPFAMRSYELGPLASLHPGLIGTWSTGMLERAHRFLFGAHGDVPESFLWFGSDLVKRGLFRLPFSYTVIEFLRGEIDGTNLDRLVFLCEQVDMEDVYKDTPPIVILIWPLLRGRDGDWYSPDIEPDKDPPYVIISAGRPADTIGEQVRVSPVYEDEKNKFWRDIVVKTLALVPAAIAMLMSRSVTVAKVEVPAKLAAARDRAGRPALFQFHVVEVPTRGGRQRSRLGLPAGPRASPMLHWRRGHYRKLATDHLVPVAPCLVGYEERGVIAKAYDGKAAHLLGGVRI